MLRNLGYHFNFMKTEELMKARRTTVKSWASLKAWMLLCLVMLCAAGVKAQTPYAIWCEENGTLYFTNSTKTYAQGDTYYGYTISNVWSGDAVANIPDATPDWNNPTLQNGCTKVDIDKSFKSVKPICTKWWFGNFQKLKNIEGLNNLNTENVRSMEGMFQSCSSLETIDLTSFHVSQALSPFFDNMFDGCSNLTTIYCYEDWSRLADGKDMFRGCTKLVGGSGTSFDSNHTDIAYACPDDGATAPGYFTANTVAYAIWCDGNSTLYFANIRKALAQGDTYNGQTITTIWSGNKVTNYVAPWISYMPDCRKVVFDESFKTVKPRTLSFLFYNASNLTTIEGLEYLDTSEATTMENMFLGCSSLTSLDVSHFDTRNVKNMSGMFLNCSGLTSITGIENLNTSNVTDMGAMFSGCSSLASLDLRNFEINLPLAAQPDPFMFNSMFHDCSSLTTIYCDTDWNEIISIYNEQASGINQMIGASKMFEGCTSLVGGKGTKYDESKIHNQYARPDLPGLPGYFTSDREYEIKPYAIWCADNTTFTFVNSAKAYVDGGVYDGTIITKVWSGEQVTETAGWMEDFSHNEDMNLHIECQKIVFDESFKDVKPSNLSQWFDYFLKVSSIEGIEYLNTSEATKMDGMFKSCSELTTIDVSNFDTSKVTDMSSMFHSCSGLTNIPGLEKLNTSNVTNMTEMFHACMGLTNIDVSNFDTRNVTDMSCMFLNCHNLTSISGIENLSTSNVTNMRNMFNGCSALTVLDLSNFDVSKVVYINQMFDGCKSLKRIYSKNDWNTQYSGTASTAYMFNDCTSLVGGNSTAFDSDHIDKEYARIDRAGTPGYFTNKNKEAYAIWCEGNSTLYFTYTTLGDTFDGQTITKVWSGEQVTETVGWMEDFSHNADMGLHEECQKIVFDESFKDVKPSNLSQWFYYFLKVSSIEGIEYLNTSEATKMDGMFKSCSELTTIDVSNFDTSNVTDMNSMFGECSGLTNILGLEKLNTSNVTNMTEMFHACFELTTIDVNNFDTRNVSNMSRMFLNCRNLTSISGMENLNTSNVTNMRNMFNGCSALTILDLSSFDVSKVVYMNQMFDGCKSLKTIYSKNDWNTQYSGETSTAFMFRDCTSLVGGNGTQYSDAYTNGIYANLDVKGKRGYFTSTFEYAISSATVGTLYMDYAVNIPEADYYEAYYVKSINSEGTLYLKKVKDVIPANTGVIIFGNEGSYKLYRSSKEVAAIDDNLLCGVAEETSVADLQTKHGKDIYVLSRGKDSYINFLKAGSGVKNIPANRAYLPYSSASGAKELSIVFDEEGGEATGIDNVTTEKAERTGVYNMAGQRVAKPQHGIYIVNGKKVVIK